MKHFRWMMAFALISLLLSPGIQATAQGRDPDLIVKNVELEPTTLKVGDILTIRAEIENTGREDVEERFDVVLKMDGARIASFRVRFTALQRRTLETTWEAVEGDHTLRIEVDEPRDQVDESNERNNIHETTFTVAPDSNIESFTRTALTAQANAWEQTSMALAFNTTSTNLLLLLDLLKEGFDDFSKATKSLVNTLQSLSERPLPNAIVEHDFFTPLLPPYRTINNAAAQVQQSLDQLDLETAINAMGDIESALRDLAAQSNFILPLAQLEGAADTLNLAIQAALEAQVRFGDASQGTVDDSIATLIQQVSAFGGILAQVAQALAESAQRNTAQFLDAQGQPARNLTGAFDVTIRAPGNSLTFELFHPNGTSALSLNGEGNALNWEGTNAQGQRLSAQTYFYRIQWQADDRLQADIGAITLTN